MANEDRKEALECKAYDEQHAEILRRNEMADPVFYTMWLKCGEVEPFRQYGFHLGTIFETARDLTAERAEWWTKQGPGHEVQLRHGDATIQTWKTPE